MHVLRDKRVLLCVGGGIAAYKCGELVRRLVTGGAEVQVAMTVAARDFVTPLTLQTLSGRPVASDISSPVEDARVGHIRIADEADVVLIAPATAGLIARLANGITNDMVTAAVLATRAPVVVAPAMNSKMLEHPATRANLDRLASYGYRIVEPESGELACGYDGPGRLPGAQALIQETAAALCAQDLAGQRVVVSAGPSREAIDPVRFISNRSSGRMGYEVALAAMRRGAAVTLVSGPGSLELPRGCEVVAVESAVEFRNALVGAASGADVVIMVAAIADYRPVRM
ncbi:MAG: bifunctional phosphopantothenoylcysteine decarboxylase/phosphopantothenate--cysteine ligase CoaBC, partial [Candidatus Binatia bacterium]